MPRKPRFDAIGCLHHMTSHGQGTTKIFKRPQDYRFFLTLLALAARAGHIRIHVFALMKTHFHLLVESVDGNISAVMQRVLSRYAAYYNTAYGQRGHVFSARFWSCPVRSRAYRFTVICYIDLNPVKAGVLADPLGYEFGSAILHAASNRSPLWLSRTIVNEFLGSGNLEGEELERAYRETFRLHDVLAESFRLVEARLAGQPRSEDDLDLLCRGDVDTWVGWLRRLATPDGSSSSSLPVVDARSILETTRDLARGGRLAVLDAIVGRQRDACFLLEAGLLRDIAALREREVAQALRASRSAVRRAIGAHRALIRTQPEYLTLAAEAGSLALDRCLGPARRQGLLMP